MVCFSGSCSSARVSGTIGIGVSCRLVVVEVEGLTSEEAGVFGAAGFAFVEVDFVVVDLLVLFFLSEALTILRGTAGAFVVVEDAGFTQQPLRSDQVVHKAEDQHELHHVQLQRSHE